MKVGRFTIKDRITLAVMGECDSALQAAKTVTVEAEAVLYLKKIVRLLCTKWSSMFIFKRDLRQVNKILTAAGFNSGKEDTEYNPDWLINLTSWMGVHIGGRFAHEVAIGNTAKEAERTCKVISRKIIDDAIRIWRIQHDPEDILHDLNRDIKKLADSEEEEIALTQPNFQPLSMVQIMKKAYAA